MYLNEKHLKQLFFLEPPALATEYHILFSFHPSLDQKLEHAAIAVLHITYEESHRV
jgi:hypothetical protein